MKIRSLPIRLLLFFCYYLALARKNRHLPSIWGYLVLLYFVGGITSGVLGISFGVHPMGTYSFAEIGFILGLVLIPTVVGHSILNHSMKQFSGQTVSIVNQLQFIFAGIMAFFIFREIPATSFYIASIMICSGVVVVLHANHQKNNKNNT